jgi:hypothetical protein
MSLKKIRVQKLIGDWRWKLTLLQATPLVQL